MYRFLLSRRWVGGFLLAVLLAVACVLLGDWQLNRYEQRSARNALVVQNYDREPVPPESVLRSDGDLPVASTWTPVRVSGRYVAAGTVLLRNRPLDGQPGYHVLVPFRTQDGATLLVDRGWLPTGRDGGRPDVVPEAPRGEVEVVARLLPPEEGTDRQAPAGQAYRIDPSALVDEIAVRTGDAAPALITGAYGELWQEEPAPADAPVPLPRPELDDGPHLGYALQWVVFAVIALGGFVVVARRTAHEDDEDDGAGAVDRRPRRPSDEEVEDAAVDAGVRSDRR